jgi:hypothetical protein
MISKDKLHYDATTPADGDAVAAFLHATLKLTSTTVGAAEALDVNIVNDIAVAVDLDGVYDVSTNPTPDTAGAIFHTRAAAPDETNQTARVTANAASADAVTAANVHGLDVNAFGMGYNGTTWDRLLATAGQLQVLPFGNVADDGVDSGAPVKVGQRAVSGALAAVSASGDRADVISDLYRRTWVNTTPNIAGASAAASIDDTAGGTVLVASALAGRRKLLVQNLDNKEIWIGFGSLSAANGVRVAAKANAEFDLGPNVSLKAIAATGQTADVRVMELA